MLEGYACAEFFSKLLAGFSIRSAFLPGLTTAYVSADTILEEPDGEFPEAVIREIVPLQRPQVWQKPVLTLGPRFAPGTSLPAVLDAFQKDVGSLVKQGLLSTDSPFVKELDGVLENKSGPKSAILGRKALPQSKAELDLDNALKTTVIAVPGRDN